MLHDDDSSATQDYIFPKLNKELTELSLRGRAYTVKKVTRDGTHLIIEDDETGQPIQLTPKEFLSLYEDEDLEIDDHCFDRLPTRFLEALDRSIEPRVDKDGWEAFRRFKYCVAFDDAMGVSKTNRGLQPLVDRVAKAIRDPDPPAPKTVARWLRERGTPGQRLARFMKDQDHRKGRSDWLDPDIDEIVEGTIDIYWLNDRQLREKEIVEAVHGEIAARNINLRIAYEIPEDAYKSMSKQQRRALGFLIEPHETTIRRRIHRRDGYETTKTRSGKSAADGQYKGGGRAPKATRVNEVWYIDHTKLDDHLVYNGKTHGLLGRPWLTVVIDGFSRREVGSFISYHPPSIHSLSLALKNAIEAKTYVSHEFPEIKKTWLAMGLPSKIVCDRALEFVGRSFELACAELGIEVVWCPRKCPRWKGIVERAIRTINTDFVELLPGATKGDARTLTKQDRDPASEAELTHRELNFLFHKWLIDVHPWKWHKGVQGRPGQIYDTGIRQHLPRMPRRSSDLNVLGMKFDRVLTRKGIHFLYLRFSDRQKVFRILDEAGKPKINVTITVDPSNLRSITVQTPSGERVILPCLDPDKVEGLSLWEYGNLTKYMRFCEYDLADREQWLVAKKEIRDTVMASLLNSKNKVSTNSRLARRLNIGGEGNVGIVVLNRLVDQEPDWLTLNFVDTEAVDPDGIYENSHKGGVPDPDPDELRPSVDDPTKTMNDFGRRSPKLPRKKEVAASTDDRVHHDTSSVPQADQPDDDIDLILATYSTPHLSRT
jgi:hypothetical protein